MFKSEPYILTFDNAIDVEKANLESYLKDRDHKFLVYLEGKRPAVWHIRHLTREEIRACRGAGNANDVYEAAFKRGLEKVDNLTAQNGEVRDWVKPDIKILSDDMLDKYFAESQVQEIGYAIWRKSTLTNGSCVPWQLQHTSALELQGLFHRNAERIKQLLKLEQNNEKLKETPPQKPLNDGETPTPAPAQEK
jgi:hypothetical protein